jgi:thioredoxin 2
MGATANTRRPVTVRCAFCGALNRVDLGRLEAGPKCGDCGRPIRLDRPVKVTDADFDKVIAGASVPVVLDCYADWCGPCRAMAPALDEFAHANAGRVLVFKLDTDANQMTAQRLGVRSIPTLIGFRDGKELRRHVGLADLRVLGALIQ